ncbi:hypothetical protein [Litoribrevibacter albus]|uniref:Adenosine deaminase n=1 Tax=Litoribrevibacter albus TaxID=1473156 RepID=A0AA37SBZ9_9GAMM|nr:hypothetical protein [Litoribrevibacter albus]GLQ33307.1 hypothetical protein GCM10007876_37870 [Litoribrevibacter albus]
MKKTFIQAIAASAVVLASGCASIINDDTQQINVISSNGEKFEGSIDGVPFEGPGIVSVERANRTKIIVSNTEACAKQTVMNKSVDPVFFVNVLSGGAFGSTTDYATEKMWKYDDTVVVSCK